MKRESSMKHFVHCIAVIVYLLLYVPLNPDTISKAGIYTLNANVVNTSGTTYSITTSNIILDLNNYMITGSAVGVSISANMANITVKNGTIAKVFSQGVLVNSGCSNITVSNIRTTSCNSTDVFSAVRCSGTAAAYISNVLIENCSMDSCIFLPGAFNADEACRLLSCSTVTVRNLRVTNNIIGRSPTNAESIRAVFASGFYDLIMDGITVSNNTMGLGGLILIQTGTGFTISNCNFYSNSLANLAAGAFDFAIRLPVAFNGLVTNCSICNNTINQQSATLPPSQYGLIYVDASSGVAIDKCLCANNQFVGGVARGVSLGFTTSVTNIVVRDTVVANNSSTIATGNHTPFLITNGELSGATTYCQLENCAAYNNSCDFSSATVSIAGFELVSSASLCSLINCVALNNTSTAGVATGFYLQNTGSCLLLNCLAAYNNGNTDANSYGIFVASSTANVYTECVAIRNGPTTPVAANQILTGASAVPAGSVKTKVYTALNGEQLQYSNEGIN
jgi:hypothetical protein